MRTRSIFYRTCGHRYECAIPLDEMSELHAEWLRNSDCESCRAIGYVDPVSHCLYAEGDRAWREQWEPSAGHLPKYVLQYLRPELTMDPFEAAFAARPETAGSALLWLAENGRG
jgi:hypothetical protein